MPSTFFGLNTAYLGLLASNASLNTTANNISNVETEGYSRQYAVQKATDALRTYTSYGCVGSGVDVTKIERHRDEFYDFKYWNNQSIVGNYEAKQYYTKQIEDYFRDDDLLEADKGFSSIFNELFNSLQELHKDSGTEDVRRAFMGNAEKLTEYFNTMYGNLQNMQKDVNSEIKVNVDRINSMANEIVTINKQINVIEIAGGTANELRDQRSLILDELSKIIDVQTQEYPITDPLYPDRETGASRFIVKIAGGQTLVDNQVSYTIDCVARQDHEKINQSDADGLYDLVWSNGNRMQLSNATLQGTLKGLYDMRDGNNAEQFKGQVTSADVVKDPITGDTSKYITVTVSDDYLKDLSKCTLPDEGIISAGAREIHYDEWSVTATYNEKTASYDYKYTFRLNSDPKVNPGIGVLSASSLVGKDAKVGTSINYQGIPYYMEQMNEWVRTFSKTFNDILTQEYTDKQAMDDYGNTKGDPLRLFVGNLAGDSLEQSSFEANYTREDYNKSEGRVDSFTYSSRDETYRRLTAGNFAVSDAIIKDPGRLTTHTGNGDEVSKFDIVEDLIDLKTNRDKMSFRNSSSSSFLQAMLSDIALNGQNAKDFASNYNNIADSIKTQRMSISGVDNDEEALNLVKFQNAYNLASKMIQVLTEVYDRLILQTGV